MSPKASPQGAAGADLDGGDGRFGATEPVDYGVLNAVWGALFAVVLAATREQARSGEPIDRAELLPLGAATFALSKVIAREKVGRWVREPFVDERGEERRPRGRRLQHAVGELLTCTRCLGAWSALGLVGLRVASPPTGRTVTAVLATSALNDFLQAGFRYVTAKSNQAED